MFESDNETEAIVLIGEIGGTREQLAAKYIKNHVTKPVVSYIAGQTAPPGKRMGHAGAIITGKAALASEKNTALNNAGVHVVESPSDIGLRMKEVMNNFCMQIIKKFVHTGDVAIDIKQYLLDNEYINCFLFMDIVRVKIHGIKSQMDYQIVLISQP